MDQWEAWLADDLEGAQAVVRCACAASEPVLAEEVVVKAGFWCSAASELTGVRGITKLRRAQGYFCVIAWSVPFLLNIAVAVAALL